MDNKRKLVAVILGVVIIIICTVIFLNKDKFFYSVVTIKYPSGCVEKYHNTIPITTLCNENLNPNLQQKINTSIPETEWKIN